MANVRLVKIAKCIKRLFHDCCRLLLSQKLLFCDVIEQLSSLTYFSYKEADSFGLPSFMQFDDIGMIEAFKNCYLVLKCFIVLYSTFLHRFYSHFNSSFFVFRKIHCSIPSTAKFLLKIVDIFDIPLARVNEPLSFYSYRSCRLALNHISPLKILLNT